MEVNFDYVLKGCILFANLVYTGCYGIYASIATKDNYYGGTKYNDIR